MWNSIKKKITQGLITFRTIQQMNCYVSCKVFWLDFLRNLLLDSNIFLIFFARASPNPSTFARSVAVAVKTLKGVPNFSSILTANFSPIPGKLQRTESCCFCKSEDFLNFL